MKVSIKAQLEITDLFPKADPEKRDFLNRALNKHWTSKDIKQSLINQLGI